MFYRAHSIFGILLPSLFALACSPAPLTEKEVASELSSDGGTNVALARPVLASSTASSTSASALTNGDRRGVITQVGGTAFWGDNTPNSYPDWVEIHFAGPRLIEEIDVISAQDGSSPVEPTEQLTFTTHGARDLSVAIWTGLSWSTVGSINQNNLVWRKFVFPAVSTTKIRVQVTRGGTSGLTRLTEIEAWTPGGRACASYCEGSAVRQCDDTCTAAHGIVTTCGQQGYDCVGGFALPSCSSFCTPSSSCFDHCSANGVESTCGSFACFQPQLRGEVAFSYQSDVNRCVNDPIGKLQALSRVVSVPSVMPFAYPPGFPQTSCSNGDHWQTVVRMPGDPNMFLVSLNNEDHSEYTGYIGIVARTVAGQLGTRMMQRNDGTLGQVPHRYNHPGGASALGTGYVFVGEEQEQATLDARVRVYSQPALRALSGLSSGDESQFVVSASVLPDILPGIEDPKGASAVAVVKLQPLPGEGSARYLMFVASQDYSYRLYYWVSQPGLPLTDPRWEMGGYLMLRTGGDQYTHGWSKAQNMNLLTDCATGGLYLISFGASDDLVRLHSVSFHLVQNANGTTSLGGGIGNGTVATLDLEPGSCGLAPCNDGCKLDAGAGAYVTTNGDLQLYRTSKYHSIDIAGFCTGDCTAP